MNKCVDIDYEALIIIQFVSHLHKFVIAYINIRQIYFLFVFRNPEKLIRIVLEKIPVKKTYTIISINRHSPSRFDRSFIKFT